MKLIKLSNPTQDYLFIGGQDAYDKIELFTDTCLWTQSNITEYKNFTCKNSTYVPISFPHFFNVSSEFSSCQ